MGKRNGNSFDTGVGMADIPPTYHLIVEAVGIQGFLNLCRDFSGSNIYVPKYESIVQKARDRAIVNEFDGGNYKELAKRYNLTTTWVRNIINKDYLEKNQISLFDDERNKSE